MALSTGALDVLAHTTTADAESTAAAAARVQDLLRAVRDAAPDALAEIDATGELRPAARADIERAIDVAAPAPPGRPSRRRALFAAWDAGRAVAAPRSVL